LNTEKIDKPKHPLSRRKPGPTPQAASMFFVYLLASKPHGTLYVGSTSDLVRRVWEHKVKAVPGFAAQYGGSLSVV